MKKLIIFTTITLILSFAFQTTFAQDTSEKKVANYSSGKYGQKNYEHFSFWSNNGERGEISYTYGKDREDVKLEYIGAKTIQGRKGFEVKFPNDLILFVIPTGNNIRVINPRGKYNKVFKWAYEGPVNGIGTFCSVCAENETDAMVILKNAYL